MKIRIKGNTLRLRLTQSEVARLGQEQIVSESIQFGPQVDQQLRYTLQLQESATLAAHYTPGGITVTVPPAVAQRWIQSEEVGMTSTQPVGADNSLQILVEKDFQCMKVRPGEDEGDNFPNPFA